MNTPTFPVEEILASVAGSVVNAQQALDEQSLASAIHISEQELDKNYGLSATWYSIPELNLELRLAFRINSRGKVETQMVDADYQSKYGFNLEASSLLQSKIVAIPPAEGAGISLLDKATVLKKAGRLKKMAEAWGRSDSPYFAVHYLPFARTGYQGGLWWVLIKDETPIETAIRAMLVIDDSDEEIVRIWTDELETPQGISFSREDAFHVVMLANSSTEENLKERVGIAATPLKLILEKRPFNSVTDIGKVSGIGSGTLQRLLDFVREANT